ncbi:MAG: DUF6484 domain-containing protein [Deferrisomatales bacterium]|nr:DUF6484 domain-containing protein [Deferrisomatales bacterium]
MRMVAEDLSVALAGGWVVGMPRQARRDAAETFHPGIARGKQPLRTFLTMRDPHKHQDSALMMDSHEERENDALELMLRKPVLRRTMPAGDPQSNESPPGIEGVVIGRLLEAGDTMLVEFPGNPSPPAISARSTIPLDDSDIGSELALLFERGDPTQPIIMGKLCHPGRETPVECAEQSPVELELDGERLTFSARREIVLRCGKASITLTRAGKVVIKGEYLLNRSTGVNRIKGGSVQIN